MKAMILAAGRGTRLQPLTNNTPKPLLKVDTFALVEHLLFKLSVKGYKEVIINVAYLADQIVDTLGDGKRYGVSIAYSREECEHGLETGGGILHALPLLGDEPFLVVSGDIWTDYPFERLKKKNLKGLAHLVLVNNPEDYLEGDFSLERDSVALREQGNRLTFGNMGVYHPELFSNYAPGFFKLGSVLRKAVVNNQVTGEHFQGQWCNIGTPEALYSLRRQVNGA